MKIVRGAIVIQGAIYTLSEWNQSIDKLLGKYHEAQAVVDRITQEIEEHEYPKKPGPLTIEEYVGFCVALDEFEDIEREMNVRLGKAQDERDAIEKTLLNFLPKGFSIRWGDYLLSHVEKQSSEYPYNLYTHLVLSATANVNDIPF